MNTGSFLCGLIICTSIMCIGHLVSSIFSITSIEKCEENKISLLRNINEQCENINERLLDICKQNEKTKEVIPLKNSQNIIDHYIT